MIKKLLPIVALAAILTAGCSTDKTRYEIHYTFDNTKMRSDFLEAYELNTSGANGKWRSERHQIDTVITNGDTIEWASGSLSEVAREDCVALQISTSGFRTGGGGNYTLDTIFYLVQGESNYINITPSHTWHSTYNK